VIPKRRYITSSINRAYNSFDWYGGGDSSKKLIAFVTAAFKAFGSTVGVGVSVGVGEGDGDNVGVGDGEGEGDGVGAGAVCRNNATTNRLHNTTITTATTSAFFTAFYSPSIIC